MRIEIAVFIRVSLGCYGTGICIVMSFINECMCYRELDARMLFIYGLFVCCMRGNNNDRSRDNEIVARFKQEYQEAVLGNHAIHT
jgi:hypothetical protein